MQETETTNTTMCKYAPRVEERDGHPILSLFNFFNTLCCRMEGANRNYPVSDIRHSQPIFSRINL